MSCVTAWRAASVSRGVGSALRATGRAGAALSAGASVLTATGTPAAFSTMKGDVPLLNCTSH